VKILLAYGLSAIKFCDFSENFIFSEISFFQKFFHFFKISDFCQNSRNFRNFCEHLLTKCLDLPENCLAYICACMACAGIYLCRTVQASTAMVQGICASTFCLQCLLCSLAYICAHNWRGQPSAEGFPLRNWLGLLPANSYPFPILLPSIFEGSGTCGSPHLLAFGQGPCGAVRPHLYEKPWPAAMGPNRPKAV